MLFKPLGWGSFETTATGDPFLTQSLAVYPSLGLATEVMGTLGAQQTALLGHPPPSTSFSPPRSWAQNQCFRPRPCVFLGGLFLAQRKEDRGARVWSPSQALGELWGFLTGVVTAPLASAAREVVPGSFVGVPAMSLPSQSALGVHL